MAHLLENSERCPMCGTAPWEWEADPGAYEAVLEDCRGCYHRELASRELDNAPGKRVALSSTRGPAALARRERARILRERDREDRLLDEDDEDDEDD